MAKGVRYGKWEVTLPDEKYVWEPDEMSLADWITVESELDGMSFKDWVTGIDERRGEPCQVLVWWLRRKNGEMVERFAVNFPIRQLDLVKIEDEKPRRRKSSGGDGDPEASAGS